MITGAWGRQDASQPAWTNSWGTRAVSLSPERGARGLSRHRWAGREASEGCSDRVDGLNAPLPTLAGEVLRVSAT